MEFNINTDGKGFAINFTLRWKTAQAAIIGLLGLLSMPELAKIIEVLIP